MIKRRVPWRKTSLSIPDAKGSEAYLATCSGGNVKADDCALERGLFGGREGDTPSGFLRFGRIGLLFVCRKDQRVGGGCC